jgi:hypothetical protein
MAAAMVGRGTGGARSVRAASSRGERRPAERERGDAGDDEDELCPFHRRQLDAAA